MTEKIQVKHNEIEEEIYEYEEGGEIYEVYEEGNNAIIDEVYEEEIFVKKNVEYEPEEKELKEQIISEIIEKVQEEDNIGFFPFLFFFFFF